MRLMRMELYRLYHDRFYYVYLIAAILLGFFFPFMSFNDFQNCIMQLFGTPGYMYGLLCSMALICTYVGKDFVYRTFQNKVSNGGKRISLITASFLTVNIGVLPIVAIFPIACIFSARMLSGWNSELGYAFQYLLFDSRFMMSFLAYLIGIIAISSICFFLSVIFKDFGKSLGFSTAYIVIIVMMTQKIHDLNSLSFLRPLASLTPLYKMITCIKQASILLTDFKSLVISSVFLICLAYLLSCIVIRYTKLK